jgi:hypothetical protein
MRTLVQDVQKHAISVETQMPPWCEIFCYYFYYYLIELQMGFYLVAVLVQ